MDAPDMQTCHFCDGKPTFFTSLEFNQHQSSFHMDVDQKMIKDKLELLKTSKTNLVNKTTVIKDEIKLMRKHNLADESVIGLLQHELTSLKMKIQEKNQDIKMFNEYQKKSTSNQFVNDLTERLDKVYINSISHRAFEADPAPTPTTVSTASSVDEDLSHETSLLRQKLSESSFLIEDLTEKSKVVETDLMKALESLDSSNLTVRQLTDEKKIIEADLYAKELKIEQQIKLIHDMESNSPSNDDEKFELLCERLAATDSEMMKLIEFVDQKNVDLEQAYNDHKLLENENSILVKLVEDLKEEQCERFSEWEKNVTGLKAELNDLEKEKLSLLCRLEDYEVASRNQVAKNDQLERLVAELEAQKADDKKHIFELTTERDSLKKQLHSLQLKYDDCVKESNQFKISYERSLQDNQSLKDKILDLQTRLESGGASKQRILQLEEDLASLRQKHNDATLRVDEMTHELNTSKEDLNSAKDEIKYLNDKIVHSDSLLRDTKLSLEKKEKEVQLKNTKLRKQDNEISQFLDQRSDLKSKITNLVKSTDKHRMAKELAEQKLKEEKMRSSELNEIVNELQDAEQCNDQATETQLLVEQQKRMELEEALENEKQKTASLQEVIAKMQAEMEAMRTSNKSLEAVVQDQECLENPTSKCSDDDSGPSEPLPLMSPDFSYGNTKEDNIGRADEAFICSSDEEVPTPKSSSTSLCDGSLMSCGKEQKEKSISNSREENADDNLTPLKVEEDDSDFCLSDDEDFGTPLVRKETVVFSASTVTNDNEVIQIPKRRWGEKYMKGESLSLDEEFGETSNKSPVENSLASTEKSLELTNRVPSEKSIDQKSTMVTDKSDESCPDNLIEVESIVSSSDSSESENGDSSTSSSSEDLTSSTGSISSSKSLNKQFSSNSRSGNKKKKRCRKSSKKITNKNLPTFSPVKNVVIGQSPASHSLDKKMTSIKKIDTDVHSSTA
uniref:Uncharacterized protein n=1 Tax=Clytia hemisphaerica TaxID=252671 RepID=A0A7M6DQX0_9CNID